MFETNNTRSLLYIIKIHLYEFTEVKIALKGQVTRAITSLCWPVVEGAAHETRHEIRVRDRSGVYAGRRSLRQPQLRNTLHRLYFTAACFRRTGTLNFWNTINRTTNSARDSLSATAKLNNSADSQKVTQLQSTQIQHGTFNSLLQ